jgi:cytochrome bd-type quinol oxidase subunit 2
VSDISIRFDGLLLGAVLVLVTLVYSLLAVGFWLGALQSPTARGRRARIARTATAFAIVGMIGVIVTTAYMDTATAVTGPDRIDWLSFPALVLFALGCWRLFRLRRG